MRRCLRVFLVGLITLSLLSGPAHACWRSRQARHCRPVVVVACPAPTWSDCCDPCGQPVVVVESPCLPATACCGDAVVMVEGAVVANETVIVGDVAGDVIESQPEAVVSQPTQAAEQAAPQAVAESKPVELERVPSQPPAEGRAVLPTSNEQPLPEPAAPAAEEPESRSVLADEPEMKEAIGEPAAATPAEPTDSAPAEPTDPPPAVEEPAVGDGDEPEMKEDEPTLPGDDAPAAPDSENPVEPPMEEDVAEPKADSEPAPAVEPDPLEPEPAAEPKPAPVEEKEGNIFEELDEAAAATPADEAAPAADAAPAGADEEMADEPDAAVRDLFAEADQADAAPAKPAAEPAEPAADLFGDSDAADPEMTEDKPAAATDDGGSEPADPFADSAPAPADDAAPTADGEPAADPEPADDSAAPAADESARGEPERRWIDATGTASMVARLIEVGADGRCVLEARGRRLAVPVENLSGHDRDYVRQAGVRLAKLRADKAGETAAAAAPAPTDTAGL